MSAFRDEIERIDNDPALDGENKRMIAHFLLIMRHHREQTECCPVCDFKGYDMTKLGGGATDRK